MVQKTKARRRSRSRRHGYRGYGSGHPRQDAGYGGAVHWGRGFSGIEFPTGSSDMLPEMRLFADERRDRSSTS